MTTSFYQSSWQHLLFLITLHLIAWMYLIMAIQSRPWYDILFGAGLIVLFLPTSGNLRYLRINVSADVPPDEHWVTALLRYAGLSVCIAALFMRWMSA